MSSLITECENKSYYEVVERAKTLEQVVQDVEEIHPSMSAAKGTTYRVNDSSKYNSSTANDKKSKKVPKNYECIRCGAKDKHFEYDCWALKQNVKCNKCQYKGHIAKMCRRKSDASNVKKHGANYIEPEEDDASNYIAMHHIEEAADHQNAATTSCPSSLSADRPAPSLTGSNNTSTNKSDKCNCVNHSTESSDYFL